jgi:iron complex outermembrane receptor protein
MRMKLYAGVAFAALTLPGAAYAQSTGSIEFNNNDIVVTGSRSQDVAGTKIPDTAKTKVELTNKFLSHEVAGQSVDETINMLPGVSFNNNDPYGSSGGTLTIRGFTSDRISQTIDGTPTNDTGNYAIYSNQQIDPELIDQVNVVLGSTDIDSPTASASGSTVNYTTITPTDDFGARLEGSVGDLNMFRVFGLVNTGVFTPWGTKAWFSASHQDYNVVYDPIGKIRKGAYNFKVYQPIGSNGDFIAVAGNWNVNRNNNTNDVYFDSFPTTKAARFSGPTRCTVEVPTAGVVDKPNTCGTSYAEGINPSDTGSLRITSSFHLAHNLVLTVDPTIQYVKANGGGNTATGTEAAQAGTGLMGYIGGKYYFGRDLNGDGDLLDTVNLHIPSQTVTHRYTLTSSLRWDISDSQSLRISYAHDYGRHRQDGPAGYLQNNGQAFQAFPINDPITAGNGVILEKRNRKSYAILDQVSGEYRGNFFDDALTLTAGLRAPFFKRELNNYCFTTSASGYVDCIAGSQADIDAYAAAHPYSYTPATGTTGAVITGSAPPGSRNYSYSKVLPSAGVTYRFASAFTLYGSFSEGLQVPGTDNLYNNYYFPVGVNDPVPETTYNFDAGLRYTTSKIQAQVGPWYTIFKNRLASSYDPVTQLSLYRNLGTVHKYGIDGSIAYQPIRQLSLYAFGSYLKSKILNDVDGGVCNSRNYGVSPTCSAATDGQEFYYLTAGKRESGSPTYTFGGRAQLNIKPIEVGIEAKRTGPRYINDQNVDLLNKYCPNNGNCGAKMPAYTVVNADARVNLGWAGLNDTTYVQFNVTNVFDVLYPGGFGGGLSALTDPFVYIAPPRTFSATLNVQF